MPYFLSLLPTKAILSQIPGIKHWGITVAAQHILNQLKLWCVTLGDNTPYV